MRFKVEQQGEAFAVVDTYFLNEETKDEAISFVVCTSEIIENAELIADSLNATVPGAKGE